MLRFLLMSHYDAAKIHLWRCGPVEIVFFFAFLEEFKTPFGNFLKNSF